MALNKNCLQGQFQDIKLEVALNVGRGSVVTLRPPMGPGQSPDGSPGGETPEAPGF